MYWLPGVALLASCEHRLVRMAPFILSTRQRFQKTRFSPGILTRAFRLKAWEPRLKGNRRCRRMDGYFLECAQKLYSQRAIDDYANVCRSVVVTRSAKFINLLSSLLKQLSPLRLDAAPGEEQREIFKAWARAYGKVIAGRERGVFSGLYVKLRKLGTHDAYFTAVEEDFTPAEKDLHEQWLERVKSNPAFVPAVRSALNWTVSQRLPVFLGFLEDLYSFSGVRDLAVCGNVPLELAAQFGSGARGRGVNQRFEVHIPKAELLGLTGFSWSVSELESCVEALGTCAARFCKLKQEYWPDEALYGSHYLMLRKMLGVDPWLASTVPNEVLKARFDEFDAETLCQGLGLTSSPQFSVARMFKLLQAELQAQGAEEKVRVLRALLPSRCVGVTAFEQICLRSEWYADTMDRVFRSWRANGGSSAHPDARQR